MKKIITLVVVLLTVVGMQAQPPKLPVTKGTVYGGKVTPDNAVSSSRLPVLLESGEKVHTKVQGKVLDVCSKKGCWMTVEVDGDQTAFVKMKDYGFFVPVELIGKTVVIDGEAFVKTTSVAELKHYAEDAKKPQSEVDAIKEPKKEIRLMADGIVVVE